MYLTLWTEKQKELLLRGTKELKDQTLLHHLCMSVYKLHCTVSELNVCACAEVHRMLLDLVSQYVSVSLPSLSLTD